MEQSNYWENRIAKAVEEAPKLNFMELLKQSWEMYAANAGNLIGYILIFMISAVGIILVPSIAIVTVAISTDGDPNPAMIVIMVMVFLAAMVGVMVLYQGFYVGVNELSKGKQCNVGDFFKIKGFFSQFTLFALFQVFLGFMVISLTLIPFLASIAPSIKSMDFEDPNSIQPAMLALQEKLDFPLLVFSVVSAVVNTFFLLTVPVIVRCNYNFFNALAASFRLTTGNFFVYLLIPLVPVIFSYVFSKIPVISLFFSMAQAFIVLPMSICIVFVILNQLIGKTVDEEALKSDSPF